ncbi:MAG: AAA family ATPase [Stigonema ocellatum SAG 48.90 = DSM 106950]|nr:AAA family ATPase [Stigonema ocellatum SAG 48.90 = DSM 106950]
MHTALHLKYRPRTLDELVGQEYVQKTLVNAVESGKIAPAYLFTGPRGTGKTSTARMFAKSLNCTQSPKPTVHPCGECQSCRSIDKSTSLDVAEIDAASNNGVDDARSLIERSSFAPAVGRYRIFLVDECLTGDSLVLTYSGLTRIDDPNIVGKAALSYNEVKEQWEFKRITRALVKGQRQTVVIKTTTSEICCTPEHLIRTENGWKKAETIKLGDRILSVQNHLLQKSDFGFSNHSDHSVYVDVANNLTSRRSTSIIPSITLLTSTGKSIQPNRTITSSNQSKTGLWNLNRFDLSVPADAVRNSTYPCIFLKGEALLKLYSSTGLTTQTFNDTGHGKLIQKNGTNHLNRCHQKAWGESTELCWEMGLLATHIQPLDPLDSLGVMELFNWLGCNKSAIACPNLNLNSQLCPMVAMESSWLLPKQSATPICEKFMQWFDLIGDQSKSISTGLVESLRKVWLGGTWMMGLQNSPLRRVGSRSVYTLKGIAFKKIKSWWTGLHRSVTPANSNCYAGKKELSLTTSSYFQMNPLNDGLLNFANTQSHKWLTSLEVVKSVTVGGIEPVYDIEVEDNHNFIANGLLVHNCHQLTVQSQNALLKCIEEPPAHVIFIFCTTEPHKVLPTITSRCQVFNFRALSITAIVEQLRFVAQKESIAITDEALVAIARTADGGLRDALQLLDQLSLLGVEITKSHILELSGSVTESDLVAIFQAIKIGNVFGLLQLSRSLLDNGKTPKLILSNLLTIYRDLLVVMASPKSQDLMTGAVSYSQLKHLATDWDYETVSTGLTQLQKSENQLRNAAQPHLWLEVCLLGLVTTRSERSNGSKAPFNSKGKSQPKGPKSNLTAVWNKVLEAATPNNRSLLTHAELVEFVRGKAVITVEAKYFNKFNSNAKKVERMFQKATGAKVTVSIKERS